VVCWEVERRLNESILFRVLLSTSRLSKILPSYRNLQTNTDEIKTSSVFTRCVSPEKADIDRLVRRQMYNHLGNHALLGILNRQSENEARTVRQCYEYESTVGLTLVREVDDTLDGVALPSYIRQQL